MNFIPTNDANATTTETPTATDIPIVIALLLSVLEIFCCMIDESEEEN